MSTHFKEFKNQMINLKSNFQTLSGNYFEIITESFVSIELRYSYKLSNLHVKKCVILNINYINILKL